MKRGVKQSDWSFGMENGKWKMENGKWMIIVDDVMVS
jgi:hypothetical protein